ncbi:MAG: Hydrolase, alpha/beta fold family protein, At1g52510/AT4G12830 homolog, group4 [uncultured Actinomycetospora sp.]|uniref:Hydrolase, alpha/beta fold family protein, At1g52510/AT4G12830 homolog, group4 n=1 Tax=uncultured Actinomycetospora sp. TaxID=1135996 RepID=A0A6J4HY87_9PSEU|nr:MAG: Hydrolase, alpha/beta fold family protein, At1g52510/AT4G12830 homolog, group4 [uncultured Actinomycetospora sp.]
MDLLRTPDDRFADLPGWTLEPRYVDVDDPDGGAAVRVATYTAGPDAAPTVLLLHGEPTWSFLYRHVVGAVVDAGLRAVAIDMVGFGRSDKPARIADHSYARHVAWTRQALDALGERDLVLVGQDWGGLIGLRLVAEDPDRFRAVVAANTGLPTGDRDMPEVWWRFRRAVEKASEDGKVLDVGRLVASGCARGLADDVRAAYDAPFPDETYKAGPRAMPLLVPTRPDDPENGPNRVAWDALGRYERPFLVAFADSDPITADMAPVLQRHVPGALGLAHPVIADAGHFLQEDAGPRLGQIVASFVQADRRRTPPGGEPG